MAHPFRQMIFYNDITRKLFNDNFHCIYIFTKNHENIMKNKGNKKKTKINDMKEENNIIMLSIFTLFPSIQPYDLFVPDPLTFP